MLSVAKFCPDCGKQNTQLIVTESIGALVTRAILTCHDCRSSYGFIELDIGYLPESMKR